MAKKLNPLCSVIGQRKIVMTRTWEEIKEMERKGIPTAGKFGEIMAKHSRQAKEEGRKLVERGEYYIDEKEEVS